ncbi:hypothetical protein BOX15_Mlig007586g1 [Macrostomum lignano]|uniref:Replication protein A OB domain-containing protein n=1 Tax=Macrostomum lignano TaxID=282301 RepID=A0A267FRQ7_9PLAT|nr:hypothetical protein BOX15_Mlig007586g1 [Macrostomum lignano]
MEGSCTVPNQQRLNIAALVSGMMKGAIIGLVSMLTDIRNYSNAKGTGQVFSFNLADEDSEIRVSVFGTNLRTHHYLCKNATAVRVSSGWLKASNSMYNSTDNELEMTLSVDKDGVLVASNEIVQQRKAQYIKIGVLSTFTLRKKVDIRGVISSTMAQREIQTKRGTTTNLAKVTLVDDSASSVSCTFWADSASLVNHWTVGDTLEVQGAQVQEYGNDISLNCTRANVRQYPANDSDLTEWFERAQSSQQIFEPVQKTQSTARPPDNQEVRRDTFVFQCSPEMFASFRNVQIMQVRCGDDEIIFSRDKRGGDVSLGQMESTPIAGPSHSTINEDD